MPNYNSQNVKKIYEYLLEELNNIIMVWERVLSSKEETYNLY